MDFLLVEGVGLGVGDVLGFMDEEYECYCEFLEIKCYLENGNQLGFFFFWVFGGNSVLDVNCNESLGYEMVMLEEELWYLEFKCCNILWV